MADEVKLPSIEELNATAYAAIARHDKEFDEELRSALSSDPFYSQLRQEIDNIRFDRTKMFALKDQLYREARQFEDQYRATCVEHEQERHARHRAETQLRDIRAALRVLTSV